MTTRRLVARIAIVAFIAAPIARVDAQRPTPGAPIDVGGFRYSRDVPAGTGLTVLTLDAAALAHSRVDDIRIVDARRRQVPYVIEPVDEPIELALAPLESTDPRANVDQPLPSTAAKRTWYRARLPQVGFRDATLRMRTNERVFRREVAVVTAHVARDAMPYATPHLESESWSHDDPSTAPPPLDIALDSRLTTDSLFVLVDDGDNRKLAITDAAIRLRTYRLRFFRDSGEAIRVVYGHPDLAAPRYDLALVAERLRDSSATTVTLGAERTLGDATSNAPKVTFWVVLIGTVVVLLVLVGRLVRGSGGEDERTPPLNDTP